MVLCERIFFIRKEFLNVNELIDNNNVVLNVVRTDNRGNNKDI